MAAGREPFGRWYQMGVQASVFWSACPAGLATAAVGYPHPGSSTDEWCLSGWSDFGVSLEVVSPLCPSIVILDRM